LAIGDSTMLLSLPGLAADGFDANARGCRSFAAGLTLLAGLKATAQLPHMVVIALGANGQVSGAQIDAALRLLGPGRLLVLVTHREEGGAVGSDRQTEQMSADRDRGHILLLDWVAHSAGHPGWFDPDGLHLLWSGVNAFTAFVASTLPYAYVVPGCQGK
jgi:hypothetical protein